MKRLFVVVGIVIAVVVAGFLVTRPHPAPKLPIKTDDPWILQTNDPKNLVGFNDAQFGPYLGNGFIGARIGPEGVGSFNGKPLPCLMAGLYENEALKPLPNWSDFPLYDSDGKRFVLDTDAPYRQTLNMRDGYVETELTLKSGRQRLLGKVTFFIEPSDYRIGTDMPQYGVCRYELTPSFSGTLTVRNQISAGSDRPTATSWGPLPGFFAKVGDKYVAISSAVVGQSGKPVSGGVPVKSGVPFSLCKYVGVHTRPSRLPMYVDIDQRLANDLMSRSEIGFERIFVAHKLSWRDLWKSDIIIDGDPAAQQAVHAMMFYLLCSANPQTSIPPNGVSGTYFSGHVFWDADTWMFPALLLQYPDKAVGIVNYRLNTMAQAAQNAKARGLQGVDFAWESAATGKETSPAAETREERHVTADAAIAASQAPNVYSAGQLIRETAVYWASRVTYNKVKDRYEILKICPPDENAGIVNNSVYTNAAAKRNIELAIEVARKMGQSYPAKWDDIVKKMYIPFDQKDGRFLAYDGYKGGKTKQADTELLIYPLAYPMTDDVKARTFDFYKTTTDKRGPAMTSSIHAIIAAELGRPDEAYKHFLDSYQPFMRGPMLMFNEKRSETYDNTCFLTGCGGTLQSVIYGFAGLRVGRAPQGFAQALPGLYIKPCLPPKWKKLQITGIKWQGKTYDLTVLPGNKWTIIQSAK